MRFADMVGQEHVGRTLGNAIQQGRVHHAYLFAGARGLGKTTTARIFAKGLVCEEGPTPEPCNACSECVAVNESRSVDVMEIDGASNNSVDNIRGLREQVHYLPQSARRKVYIIDEVHMLTTSAFNALLKTLEEPPPHVNFVFATTEPQKVLPTIMSRVSRLDFRRVSPEELIAHLASILEREGARIDDGGLRIIARASGGSVRDALTLLDQVIAFSDDPDSIGEEHVRGVLGQAGRSAIAGLVDAVLERDPDAVVARFDELVASGHDLMVLSMQLLEHLRDLTLVKVCRSREVLPSLTDSEVDQLRGQAAKVDAPVLGQLFDRFTRIVDRLPTSRVQRLLIEMGLLELAQTEPLIPLGDLVDRLHTLTAEAGGSGSGSGSGTVSRTRGDRPAAAGARGGSRRADASPGGPRQPGRAPTQTPPEPPQPIPQASVASRSAPSPSTGSPSEPAFANSELSRDLWQMAKASGVVGRVGSETPTEHPAVATGTPPTRISDTLGREPTTRTPPAPKSSPEAPPPGSATGCSPCEPPPPPPGIIDVDALEAFEAWEQLVSRVRVEDEYVSAVLGEVGLAALRDGVLRVAAPPHSFAHTELSSRPEIRAHVEQATRDHFGRPYRLELVEGEPVLPALPSIVLVEQQRRERHQSEVEAEARQHPGIQTLLRAFDAQLTSTKPL